MIGAGTSLRYFTGVPWGASERLVALLLTLDGDPVLICPAFEEGSLDAVLKIAVAKHLWEEHEDPYALVVQAMDDRHAHALALDPGIAFAVHTGLRAHLGTAIRDAAAIIDGCRMCKSPAELALMQQACDMTLLVQRLAAGIAQEGIGTDQLVRFIDQAHRALGADNGSTFCIVQFGHATAFPHGIPGVQHLRAGELVLIDTGCTVQGYHSISPVPGSTARPTTRNGASGTWNRRRRQPRLRRSAPGSPAKRWTRPRAACWRPQGWARITACRDCRTAPAMAAAWRSTKRRIWCAAMRSRCSRACAPATSR